VIGANGAVATRLISAFIDVDLTIATFVAPFASTFVAVNRNVGDTSTTLTNNASVPASHHTNHIAPDVAHFQANCRLHALPVDARITGTLIGVHFAVATFEPGPALAKVGIVCNFNNI
jgi:hypothetical protein